MDMNKKNDILYVCTLIEFLGRSTKNKRSTIVSILGKKELERQLELACVNHSLPLEQVTDELINELNIEEGSFDSVGNSIYQVPSVSSIAKNYMRLIIDCIQPNQKIVDVLYEVFSSFISDEISDFNTSVYYSSPEYLKVSYEEGKILM